MRAFFDVAISAQRLAAGTLAAGGLGLLIWGAGGAATAFRARQAFVSPCDRIPSAATNGVWVRLQGCGISRLREGFLDDAKRWHVRRLVPVWPVGQPASIQQASQIAAAVPISATEATDEQPGLRVLPEPAPIPDGSLSPLADTMGVVIGRISSTGYRAFGTDVGVAEGAVIIDVVAPPTFKDAATRALLGFVALGLAWLAYRYELPARPARTAGPAAVDWSRVLVFASVGVVAITVGVRWFSVPPRARSSPTSAAAPAAALAAPSKSNASLDQLLARVPRDRRAFDGTLSADLSDTIDALITHANDAPEQIRDALMPAMYSTNDTTRRKVLTAFRSMNLSRIPSALIAEASGKGPFQRQAFEAALALGARRTNPELLIAGSRKDSTSLLVQQELRLNTDDASARILARIWVDGADFEFARIANAREKSSHDISAALLEIVLDNKQPETRRTQAAYRLGTLNEVGALPPLRTFSMSLAPGVLKQSLDNTVDRLDLLRRQGRAPQMRALR
jgi:hypothetical protein